MKFSIGRTPVQIFPMFFVLILAIGWLSTSSIPGTIIWGVVILLSVLIHEMGHALTATFFGQKTRIELYGMGGMTYRLGKKIKLWQEFIIVMNGPIAGFMLCLLAIQLSQFIPNKSDSFLNLGIHVAIYVNLFWTVINLIPILPLDGGHLLRIILEGIFGLRGVKISYFLSMLIAGSISLLLFATGDLLIGSLFMIFGFDNFRIWRGTLALTNQDQDASLQIQLAQAEREMRIGNVTTALEHFENLRERTKEGVIFVTATECSAEILSHMGRYREAYDILFPLRSKIRPQMLHLLHQIAYRSGKWQEAITLGNQSYQYTPTYDTAVVNAICHAILGEAVPAIGWLRCAIDEGLPNASEVLSKREFDHIRDTPAFQNLLQ